MSTSLWPKKKISWLFDVIGSGTTPSASNEVYYNSPDVPWLNTGDLKDSYIEKTSKYVSQQALKDFSALTIFPKESLVMAMYGATIGKLGITKYKTTTNQACCVLGQPKGITTKFTFYWLMGHRSEIINLSQGGGQPNISQGIIRNIRIAVPPLELQNKIVDFINKKFDETNLLVNKKEQMIKLLEQQRQSIITETVTKGLNPNVKMKDSGVEGIGKIPEHWDLKRLKYALILNPSKNEVSSIKNINVTFLPMENILAPNEVDISIKKKIEEVYNGYTYFKNNDLVLAKVTPCFENGNIAVMENMENGIGFGTTELHVLRPRTKQNISFYYYLAQSGPFKQQGVSTMYGVGGLKRIPNEFVLNYEFGMPPLAEQNEIVDFLNCKCREIQNAKHSIKLQIEKLKEYRQSLIYEAVTGKIDVRDMELD